MAVHRMYDVCRCQAAITPEALREKTASLSAPEGIRTPNLLIRSQMLYPLSYGRLVANDRRQV